MNKKEAWDRFCATGSVADYLRYADTVKGEGKNEDQHGRPYHKERLGGGK